MKMNDERSGVHGIVYYMVSGLILVMFLSGCIRATMVSHERVDRELEGNRGFISGTPPPMEQTAAKEQKVIEIDVDFPPRGEEKESEPETWGNRGYLTGGPAGTAVEGEQEQAEVPKIALRRQPRQRTPAPPRPLSRRVSPDTEAPAIAMETEPEVKETPAAPAAVVPAPEEKEPQGPVIYKVKKGDTLWKLARKFYGNPDLWKKIHDANKDKIKNPNRIYPGQVLNIPPKE